MKTTHLFESFGISDIGSVRKQNEDVFASLPEKGLFIIADGMGGHKGGKIAAQVTVSKLLDFFTEHQISDPLPLMQQALQTVNSEVYRMSQKDPALRGMGTTLVLLILFDHKAFFAHVGDSRMYCLRNQELAQKTEDHSLVNELIALGTLKKGETVPFKNVLTKAIGTHPKVEGTFDVMDVEKGDLFLLATDGLTNYVPHQDIKKVLMNDTTLEAKGKELIELAKIHGGGDNITLILIQF